MKLEHSEGPQVWVGLARADLLRVLSEATRLAERAQMANPNQTLTQVTIRLGELFKNLSKNSTLRMIVMALAKSGKSTLINAWIGGEFLPVANIPETARVVRISHVPSFTDGRLREGAEILAEGVCAINGELKALNLRSREQQGGQGCGPLHLDVPVVALTGGQVALEPPGHLEGIRFEIIDTPGPNEAGADGLKDEIYRLVEEADALLYLLDFTKLKTDSEAGLFALLGQLRPELRTRISETLFFAVNKFDQRKRNDLNAEETRNYINMILTDQLHVQGLNQDRIHLISAEQGFLGRVSKLGRMTEAQKEDAARLIFGQLNYDDHIAEVDAKATELLEKSGLEPLERSVLRHVFNNRQVLLLTSLTGKALNELERLMQQCCVTLQGLDSDETDLKQRCDDLEQELNALTSHGELFDAAEQELLEEHASKMSAEFRDFKETRLNSIESIMSQSENLQLFDHGHLTEESKRKMDALSKKIAGKFKSEVTGFTLRFLPSRAYSWFPEINRRLEDIVEQISGQIEAEVGKRLRLTLKPIRISIELSDFDTGLAKIQEEMNRLREQNTEERKEKRKRKIKVPGFCCDSEDEIEDDYKVLVNKVSREMFLDFWKQKTYEVMQTSEKVAQDRLRKEILRTISNARNVLARYAEGYIKNMRNTLSIHQKGQQALAEARAENTGILGSCEELIRELKDVRVYMEARK